MAKSALCFQGGRCGLVTSPLNQSKQTSNRQRWTHVCGGGRKVWLKKIMRKHDESKKRGEIKVNKEAGLKIFTKVRRVSPAALCSSTENCLLHSPQASALLQSRSSHQRTPSLRTQQSWHTHTQISFINTNVKKWRSHLCLWLSTESF